MALIDYHLLPNLDLFGIFTCHLCIATCVLALGGSNAFLFYNTMFLFILLWCIKDSQNEIPLILAIRVNIIGIVSDVILLFRLIFFSRENIIMPVFAYLLHVGFRFMSTPLLSKMCSDKTGGLNDGLPQALTPVFGVDPGAGPHDPYENIDNVPHQSYPKTEPVINSSQSYNISSNVPTYQA